MDEEYRDIASTMAEEISSIALALDRAGQLTEVTLANAIRAVLVKHGFSYEKDA